MKKQLVLIAACSLVMTMATSVAIAEPTAKEVTVAPAPAKVECPCKKESWEAKKDKWEKQIADDEAQLKLTKKQIAQTKALREANKKQMMATMDEIKAKHDAMDALKADKFAWAKQTKRAEKVKLNEELVKLHEQAKTQKTEFVAGYEKILTAAQKTEFQKIQDQRKAEMEARRAEMQVKANEKCLKHKMFKKDCKVQPPCKKHPVRECCKKSK